MYIQEHMHNPSGYTQQNQIKYGIVSKLKRLHKIYNVLVQVHVKMHSKIAGEKMCAIPSGQQNVEVRSVHVYKFVRHKEKNVAFLNMCI